MDITANDYDITARINGDVVVDWEKSFSVVCAGAGGWEIVDAECDRVAPCDSIEKAQRVTFALNAFVKTAMKTTAAINRARRRRPLHEAVVRRRAAGSWPFGRPDESRHGTGDQLPFSAMLPVAGSPAPGFVREAVFFLVDG
jgi:hypothetical protein